MTKETPIKVDISKAVDWPDSFPSRVEMVISIYMPDVNCQAQSLPLLFCFPGGGYSRHYFDLNFDHISECAGKQYSQANYHADHGMIIVTCDHLGVGESTVPADPMQMTLDLLIAANTVVVEYVIQGLKSGSLVEDFAPIEPLPVVGLGQSMGGAITLSTQAKHHCFDAIVILAYGIFGVVPVHPEDIEGLPEQELSFSDIESDHRVPTMMELWYQDDVPQAIIEEDTRGGYPIRASSPIYGSLTIPPCAMGFIAPGFLAKQASQIKSPVLLARGDSDVLAEPKREPSAYSNAKNVTDMEIENMGHMHNFAGSRIKLWRGIQSWISTELAYKSS